MKFSFVAIVLAFGVTTILAAPIPHSSDVHTPSSATPVESSSTSPHDPHDGHDHSGHDHDHDHTGHDHTQPETLPKSSTTQHTSRRDLVYDILQERYPSVLQAREYSGRHVARALIDDILRERDVIGAMKAMAAQKVSEAITGAPSTPAAHPDGHADPTHPSH